jgi:hypothetical protein
MKSSYQASIFASLILVSTFGAAHAADRRDTTALAAARHKLHAAAGNTKGIPRANLDIERARLQRLIDALERGDQVNPAEIDRELERAENLAR